MIHFEWSSRKVTKKREPLRDGTCIVPTISEFMRVRMEVACDGLSGTGRLFPFPIIQPLEDNVDGEGVF